MPTQQAPTQVTQGLGDQLHLFLQPLHLLLDRLIDVRLVRTLAIVTGKAGSGKTVAIQHFLNGLPTTTLTHRSSELCCHQSKTKLDAKSDVRRSFAVFWRKANDSFEQLQNCR